MVKLNLRPDESIILKSKNISDGGLLSSYADELILTNYNIYHVNKGMFGNIKNVYKFPVNQVKIYNGEPQVILGKHQNNSPQLEIYFQNGHKFFSFQFNGKKEIVQWINAITKLLTGYESTSVSSAFALPGTSYIAETIKGTVDTFKNTVGAKTNRRNSYDSQKKVAQKCISCSAPLHGVKGRTLQCKYCDTDQIL